MESDGDGTTGDAAREPPTKRRKVVRQKKYICTWEDCGKAFDRPIKLTRHTAVHTGNYPFPCTVEGCTRSFTRKDHMERHILAQHSNERNYVCKIASANGTACLASFQTEDHLRRHERRHLRTYKCPQPDCAMAFNVPVRLESHLFIAHQYQKTLACPHPLCSRVFACDTARDYHASKCHPQGFDDVAPDASQRADRTCETCGVVCASANALAAHACAGDLIIRSFPCDSCARVFRTQGKLLHHMELAHSGPKEVLCTVCSKSFSKRSNMMTHMRAVHEDLRPFVCSNEGCTAAYRYRVNLQKHLTTCTQELGVADLPRPRRSTDASANAHNLLTLTALDPVVPHAITTSVTGGRGGGFMAASGGVHVGGGGGGGGGGSGGDGGAAKLEDTLTVDALLSCGMLDAADAGAAAGVSTATATTTTTTSSAAVGGGGSLAPRHVGDAPVWTFDPRASALPDASSAAPAATRTAFLHAPPPTSPVAAAQNIPQFALASSYSPFGACRTAARQCPSPGGAGFDGGLGGGDTYVSDWDSSVFVDAVLAPITSGVLYAAAAT